MTNNNGIGQKLQLIFSPAISVLNRMGYTRKFTLLWLMSSVAIAVVTYSLFASLDKVIQPSQRQLQGLALIEPISLTLQLIQLHRGMSAALLGGNEMMRDRRAAQENKAAEAFKAMEEKLPPGLASNEGFRHIKADWEQLRKQGLHWTVAENFAAHTRLIEQVLLFEVFVADEYLLTLDQEIASSYLIFAAIIELPKVLEHLGQARAYGTGILSRKQITEPQKIELNVMMGELGHMLKSLDIHLDKAGRYNPAMQKSLLAVHDGIADSARQITGLVVSDILTGHFATPPEDFLDMATAEIDKAYTQMYQSLLPAAKTLIEARIARAKKTLLMSVGGALLLFLLAVYISVGMYYAIVGSIRSLVRSAHTFADGDLNQRVKLSTRDELSEIGDSFNKMADGFNVLLEKRKQAEESLRKSADLLQSVVENAPVRIFWKDRDSRYLGCNTRFAKDAGHSSPDELTGNTDFEMVWKDQAELYCADDAEVMDSGNAKLGFEEPQTTLDGNMIWLRTSKVPLRDENNRVIGILGIYEDITEHKQAEEAIRKAKDLLQSVLDNVPVHIFWKDRDSRYLGCNTQFAKAAGHSSQDELTGKTDFDIWRKDLAELYRAGDKDVMDSGNAKLDYEEPGTTPDGNMLWARTSKVPLRDESNRVIGILGIYEDITERKRAEDSLRKLSLAVEQSPHSIIITDLDANIEYVNEAFIRTSGYSRAEAIGQNPRLLHSGRNPKATYDDLWAHLIRGEEWKGELINRRKDGSEYIESAFISPVRLADGRVANYLAIQEDITNRKRMEAELLQLNDELEEKVLVRTAALEQARRDADQANRAKSAFLSAMSHEIRTPMNGVVGMIDVLQQSNLNGQQIETVNIIHDSAFALLAIIDDILDFSKIEAGKLQIDYAPMGVAGVVEGVCETLIPLALKKGVELTLFTDPGIPSQVLGDAGRLRQILVNLANNAIKFSSGQQRQGKVSVRAVLAESTPEQVKLKFFVADNGIGMDEATLARLFTPFTQADTSTTRTYGGTGLGLAISRQLANIMGGEIAVQSKPGKGSVFSARLSFALPLEQTNADAVPPLVAALPCLVVGALESLADDLAAYLVHDGAVVERSEDLAAIDEWIAGRTPGLCIVLIDTAGSKPPLDNLRAAARAHPEQQTRFVIIGRGQRREPRLEDADLVVVDGNALTRRALLKAVAIASGRSKAPDREATPGDVNAKLTPLSREEAKRQGRLILVAEDNEINQKVILQQLALLGQAADIANNGREALELWRSGDYAILVTDLHMPEMDGYELTAAIRAAEKTGTSETHKPRKPIIAFTANALKGEAEHCIDVGMDDYLSKPVQLVNLKAMLEKWLPVAVESAPVDFCSPHDNAGHVPGFHPGYIASPDTVPVAVDVNVLKKLVGDDEEIIRDFLHDFRLSAAKIAAELRTTCAAGQATAAGAHAHKLKSSSRSVGALALGELCAEMEQAGKAGDMATLAMLLPRFELELASVEGFLEGY